MKYSRVYIEISNICNLQCDFCPVVERQKKIMSFELFQKIIDQLQGLTEEVTFHLMGEPLTHPQFHEFVLYCAQVNMPINLTTNGTLIKHIIKQTRRDEILLNKSVRQVNFSLQSFTSNFPQGDINSYLQNIFEFTHKAAVVRPDLYINYRLWNHGSDEANKTQNAHFLEPIKKEFGYELQSPVDVAFRKSRKIMDRLYLHFDSRFEWPSKKGAVLQESGFCYGLKTHFAIHSDGTVVPCCLDKEAGIPLGSALELLATLQSQRATSLRQGFDQFQIKEDLCRRCDYITRFASKKKSFDRALNI